MFVNGFWDDEYNGDDPFNYNGERNSENTEYSSFNCAGFALETYSWYLPVPDDTDIDSADWGSTNELKRNALSLMFVNQILLDFYEDTRLITSLKQVKADEYAFAFRVGEDDFHFVKRDYLTGVWAEKRGGGDIYFMDEDEVFHSAWNNGRYNGPIFLFAKKIG